MGKLERLKARILEEKKNGMNSCKSQSAESNDRDRFSDSAKSRRIVIELCSSVELLSFFYLILLLQHIYCMVHQHLGNQLSTTGCKML